MGLRIGQYGWTPERIWGVIAVGVALAYGLAGLWAVAKGRRAFDDRLRPLQQRPAIALMLLAAFLALPVLDFGTLSRSEARRVGKAFVSTFHSRWSPHH